MVIKDSNMIEAWNESENYQRNNEPTCKISAILYFMCLIRPVIDVHFVCGHVDPKFITNWQHFVESSRCRRYRRHAPSRRYRIIFDNWWMIMQCNLFAYLFSEAIFNSLRTKLKEYILALQYTIPVGYRHRCTQRNNIITFSKKHLSICHCHTTIQSLRHIPNKANFKTNGERGGDGEQKKIIWNMSYEKLNNSQTMDTKLWIPIQ